MGKARLEVTVPVGVVVGVLARLGLVQEEVVAGDKATVVPPEHQHDPQDVERLLEVGEANLAKTVL